MESKKFSSLFYLKKYYGNIALSGGYVISDLVWDLPALTKCQYFWNVTWPDFWNSPKGKWLAVGLFILSIILTAWLSTWTIFGKTFIYGTATFFAIGAIIRSYYSRPK